MPIKKQIDIEFPEAFTQAAGTAWALNSYQFSNIQKREKEWFMGQHGEAVLAYSFNDPIPTYVIVTKLTRNSHVNHLLKCQAAGYRFIALRDYRLYESMHPVCSRCIKKLECSQIGKGCSGLAKAYLFNGDQFGCYSGPEDIKVGITADLLKPIERFRLQ
ncbi:hypothetical protein SAMN05444008_10931 [Cnuella takakiae]|uniref:Uncharacterized protein n=1 Tax=Cnuella takakiae TaxID=1302690 RepID=A0A1M5CE56_9BACT|nr:hypothetical protein [Cnuella takakiae]SHF53005.1 hypothetical protein SAMN05444008_10931 [Cnuella takakiae]